MSILQWSLERNLENSVYMTLKDAVDGLFVINQEGNNQNIFINIGKDWQDSWQLPSISFYISNTDSPRLEIGSNLRDNVYNIIIDIRALDDGMRSDLVNYVVNSLNNGFVYSEYTANILNPEDLNSTIKGYVTLDWVSSQKVELGEDVDLADKYRHRLTLRCWITQR